MPMSARIKASPHLFRPFHVVPGTKPHLFIVVDTEEEFDWSAPFSRSSTGVTAIAEVWRLQEVAMPFNLRPTYVIDYPVAADSASGRRFREMAERGECEIGAHLHPWVNPPHLEPVTSRTSYPCNLDAELEMEKIRELKHTIVDRVGVTPRVYKAGRYGFDATTASTLEELDFDVDVSVNPHMDFTPEGPSFAGFAAHPSVFGVRRRLVELPCTTGFTGLAHRNGERLHRLLSSMWAARLHMVGISARIGLLNRVMLSPEGNSLQEMKDLTETLLGDGVRTFALTFHSPSLKPGCTPYVRSLEDRDRFLDTLRQYFRYFVHELGGVPTTPAALFDSVSGGTSI
jgi:hypothetical protein